MRIGTAVLFLSVSLAFAACKKKSKTPTEPAKEEATAEPAKPAPPVPAPPPRDEPAAGSADDHPTTTEGLGEAESEDPYPEALEIKIGETYILSQGRETVVMNPKPVSDGIRRFPRGAVCRFDPEGKVKIVGKRVVKEAGEEEVTYLARYTRDASAEALRPGATEDADALPYECPTGTVFFLDEPDLLEEDEPDARFDAARKLLDSEKP